MADDRARDEPDGFERWVQRLWSVAIPAAFLGVLYYDLTDNGHLEQENMPIYAVLGALASGITVSELRRLARRRFRRWMSEE